MSHKAHRSHRSTTQHVARVPQVLRVPRTGTEGIAGPTGTTSTTGPTGTTGPTRVESPASPTGVAGPAAPTGPTGAAGSQAHQVPRVTFAAIEGALLGLLTYAVRTPCEHVTLMTNTKLVRLRASGRPSRPVAPATSKSVRNRAAPFPHSPLTEMAVAAPFAGAMRPRL